MLIKKGTHGPLRQFELLEDCKRLSYSIMFTNSCAYNIGPADQLDVNKLFGIGYITFKFLYLKKFNVFGNTVKLPWARPMHHVNSVKFGWRYDPQSGDMMEIVAYWYDNAERWILPMGYVKIGKYYDYTIKIKEGWHTLEVYDIGGGERTLRFSKDVLIDDPCDLGYRLNLYFGGNQKAPHDMSIVMERL